VTAGRRHPFGRWGKWVLMALRGVTRSDEGYFLEGRRVGEWVGCWGRNFEFLRNRIRANAATGNDNWEASGEMRLLGGGVSVAVGCA
jgi:hypothetical protein